MAAVNSDDGGDVVLALEELRIEGILERDLERGRYCLVSVGESPA